MSACSDRSSHCSTPARKLAIMTVTAMPTATATASAAMAGAVRLSDAITPRGRHPRDRPDARERRATAAMMTGRWRRA
jgi:hypothetical protein